MDKDNQGIRAVVRGAQRLCWLRLFSILAF